MVDVALDSVDISEIKLICLDLDGTLLDSSKKVSQGNRDAIARVLAAGIEVAIASGRHPFNIAEMAEGLGLPHTAVCLSGAYVMREGSEVFRHGLSDENVQKIIDIAEKHRCYISLAGGDFNLCAGYINRVGGETPATRRYMRFDSYDALRGEVRRHAGFFLKGAVHHDDLAVYEEVKRQLSSIGDIEAVQSDIRWCDAIAKGCSKAEGVSALARALGYTLDNVAALGDDENDVELISAAGLGIAMGNALPQVKAVANAQTLVNDQDGVAYAIDKILEKRA